MAVSYTHLDVYKRQVPAVAEEDDAGLAIEAVDLDAEPAIEHDSVVAVEQEFDPVLAESSDSAPQETGPVFELSLIHI